MALIFVELMDGAITPLGGFRVTPYLVLHASAVPAYALRVASGEQVLASSADTAWTTALCQAAAQTGRFICEAYVYDRTVKYHLNDRTLQANRALLSCRRLVLTYLRADMLAHLWRTSPENSRTVSGVPDLTPARCRASYGTGTGAGHDACRDQRAPLVTKEATR